MQVDKLTTFNIQTAHNQAATVKSHLSQFSGIAKDEPYFSDGYQKKSTDVYIRQSLVASENNYTKKDALLKQWYKQGDFNLYTYLKTGKLDAPLITTPTEEELVIFEKSLQENGISGQADWSRLEADLRGIGFSTESPTFQLKADDFSRKTDFLTSRYAAFQEQLKKTYTGDELNQQLSRLDDLFQNKLHELASGYSDVVDDFLKQNGVDEQRDKIYTSVINGVEEKAEMFQRLLNDKSHFTELLETDDAWLMQDDAYVAAQLRAYDKEEIKQNETLTQNDQAYNLHELDVLGQFVSHLSAFETGNLTDTIDEGKIGLDFFILSTKTEALKESGKLGQTMKDTLTRVTNGFMASFLDRLDNQLSQKRSENERAVSGYAQLNRSAIWNVYNVASAVFKETKDIGKAISDAAISYQKTLNNAALTYNQEEQSYRSINNSKYWTNFFASESKDASEPTRTGQLNSLLTKYGSDWYSFKNSLGLSNTVKSTFGYQEYINLWNKL